MKFISFTIFRTPLSQNSVYRRRKGYGMYMTDKGKAYKAEIAYMAKTGMIKGNYEMFFLATVNIKLYFNNKRKNDIDGPIKLILDSMNGVVWKDDQYIEQLHIYKKYDKTKPRIEITVSAL